MLGIGTVLDGKYKILNEIGRGGMSVVYLALNEKANKTWAVKEVRKDREDENGTVIRGLAAETEMLKKLSHRNLPSIVDVIDTEESFIIVMDYVEGKSLQDVLDADGPQDPERVAEWAKQLTDVLGYLHGQDPPVIYRDMKPANIMLRPDGQVMLIDFGTAREYKTGNRGDTSWLGTRGYAAPEQFGGQGQTDARTDIYCLGATMYHLLTGYSPADTQFVIRPPGELLPSLAGSGIEKVVLRCCAPDPESRYQNCAELMYALVHVHEEDDVVRRVRNRKWAVFLAACFVTVLGAAGMTAFAAAGRNAVRNSYDSRLNRAKEAVSIADAAALYEEAVALRPGKPEAYRAFLEAVTQDGSISEEEKALFKSMLSRIPSGRSRENIYYLEKEDPCGYFDLCFEAGFSFFRWYGGSRLDAYQYLEAAVNAEVRTADPEQAEAVARRKKVADSLCAAAGYYVDISKTNQNSARPGTAIFTDTYDYRALWEKLTAITGEAETADLRSGGADYSLALFRETAVQIAENVAAYAAAGVTEASMRAAVREAEKYISLCSSENAEMIYQTGLAVERAKDAIRSQFETAAVSHSEEGAGHA